MSRKTWLIILVLLTALALIMFTGVQERPAEMTQRNDLPWLITTYEDGTSSVLDIHLGQMNMKDAAEKFGTPEGIALFAFQDVPGALEVYFGNVSFGPLKAKVIVNLAATDEIKKGMLDRAISRQYASGNDARYTLSEEDQQVATGLTIESITYIPAYGGLEADFFRERLGEPTAWLREDDERILWFYPDKGLTLLLDADGKEVFQYDQPRHFLLPENADSTSPAD